MLKSRNAALYDAVIEKLGYSPDNAEHRLIGFGVSLGGMQVESMAFITGKKFEGRTHWRPDGQ